jgi:hypothetical protein
LEDVVVAARRKVKNSRKSKLSMPADKDIEGAPLAPTRTSELILLIFVFVFDFVLVVTIGALVLPDFRSSGSVPTYIFQILPKTNF